MYGYYLSNISYFHSFDFGYFKHVLNKNTSDYVNKNFKQNNKDFLILKNLRKILMYVNLI